MTTISFSPSHRPISVPLYTHTHRSSLPRLFLYPPPTLQSTGSGKHKHLVPHIPISLLLALLPRCFLNPLHLHSSVSPTTLIHTHTHTHTHTYTYVYHSQCRCRPCVSRRAGGDANGAALVLGLGVSGGKGGRKGGREGGRKGEGQRFALNAETDG